MTPEQFADQLEAAFLNETWIEFRAKLIHYATHEFGKREERQPPVEIVRGEEGVKECRQQTKEERT